MKLEELAGFLVRAKKVTYAGGGPLKYTEGDWEYEDEYDGFYFAPGREVVKFKGERVWFMAYSGGMKPEYHDDEAFAKQTFAFLKKALMLIEESKPYRGPERLEEGEWEYINQLEEGNITDFLGTERILYQGKEVFRQHYMGGVYVYKK